MLQIFAQGEIAYWIVQTKKERNRLLDEALACTVNHWFAYRRAN